MYDMHSATYLYLSGRFKAALTGLLVRGRTGLRLHARAHAT